MRDGTHELANSPAFLVFYRIQCPVGQRSKLRNVSHRYTKIKALLSLYSKQPRYFLFSQSRIFSQLSRLKEGNVMFCNVKISAEEDCHMWGKRMKTTNLVKTPGMILEKEQKIPTEDQNVI